MIHLTGECKIITMTRYETNKRSPKEGRLKELSKILLVDSVLIKNQIFQIE